MINDALQRLLLENLTTATLLLNARLRLEYMNPAAEMLLAVSGQRSHGQFISELFTESPEALSALRQAVAEAHPFTKREATLTSVSGQTLTVDYAVTPIPTQQETMLLLEVLPRDRLLRITKDEAQLSTQETTKLLVRGLAHEIKNPLGGIRGAAQLLEREFPDSEHLEYTRVIIREADRLQNLVNRLLGPNRLPQKEMVNIHEVLEHVRQLIEAEGRMMLAVQRDYDPSIPEVRVDREQLIQAALNLARNALQSLLGATPRPDRPLITLRTRMRRQFTIGGVRHKLAVQIDIEDNGGGIAPAMLEKIFYPMVTTRAEGTGLGLPIAQYLINSHGGLIECQSRPGITIFSIFLPLELPA